MNILELITLEKRKGYNEINANAKVCQDIILLAISLSSLDKNVTIKGGVVMRSKTQNVRRATQDLDIDFIKYSISKESIDHFIHKIDCVPGITISRIGEIEELKQQDYSGKRIHIEIEDKIGNKLRSKLDIGVHNKFEIKQESYCFDIALNDEGVNLLINTSEQMFTEKLKSLLKFGSLSTRYKDIYDMYFLINNLDKDKLERCIDLYIYQDISIHEKNINDIIHRIQKTFQNKTYLRRLISSDKKWIDEDIDTILGAIVNYLMSLERIEI